ncbi:MAG: NAD(P)/FAD-dependent oxidoreductase [Endomicrobium sp.]|jgi:dihydrolipoamide dehydrogenase|nr:NAD(P)/FAD-dependent oxidoreductase [Endomicrobium sp.]
MSLGHYDIIVIGAGPGGFTAAVKMAQLGAKIAIVEKYLIGGTCLNTGCIPTKFLWNSLKIKKNIKKANYYGFKTFLEEPVKFQDIILKKNKSIYNLRQGMIKILDSYSIDIIYGHAKFKDKNNLLIYNKNNIYEISADNIVIATGSEPLKIIDNNSNDPKFINSTEALSLIKIPKNMLIIGAGVIGIELATIFSGFGCQVTLTETENRILAKEDLEISDEISKNLLRSGVNIITSCNNALNKINEFEKILVTIGRKPLSDLSLTNIGLKTNKKGFIETDEFCCTNIKNIYAIGDITGRNLLAYTAQNEGVIVAKNIIKGHCISLDNSIIPQVIFSIPISASVKISGFSQYKDVIFGKFPLTASCRAAIEFERTGFVKCAVDKSSKKPLGFWIIGSYADEIICTASQILKSGIKYIQRETFFHPSFNECLLNAYEEAFNECTDLPKNKKKEF